MSLSDILERAEALYFDTELSAVKRWREENGGNKAIGYLPI